MAVCVAKKTLMRVIDEDDAMHGVVMVMVSEHGAGVSCGVAKLKLKLPLLPPLRVLLCHCCWACASHDLMVAR